MVNSAKWLNTITLLSLCAMIFTLPFSKSAVEIFFIVALISWILKRILSYKINLPLADLFKPVSTPLNLPLYLFVLLGFLSILTSVSIPLSLKGFFFKLLEGVLIYFIAAEIIDDRKKLNLVLIVMVSSILLICTDGIFQYITGRDFIRHYPICGENRIQASFSNPNGLAGWLALIFPLVLSLGIIKYKGFPKKIIRPLIWGLICAAGLCLTLTYSRGAWIGAVLALFFIGILKKSKFLIIAILIVIAVPLIMPVPIKERLLAALPFTIPYSIKGRLSSIALFNEPVRNNLWHETIAIIQDFPILGCGLNTYSIIAPNYKITVDGGTYPHNSYLQMAAEMGIVGLAAFIWMMIRLFKASLESIKRIKDGFYSNVLIGLLAGMLAFLVHSFFDVNFYVLQLVNLMWFVMGLIIAVQRIALNEIASSFDPAQDEALSFCRRASSPAGSSQ
jgi:putative inorganic carbon (HCO3(-)) transporter